MHLLLCRRCGKMAHGKSGLQGLACTKLTYMNKGRQAQRILREELERAGYTELAEAMRGRLERSKEEDPARPPLASGSISRGKGSDALSSEWPRLTARRSVLLCSLCEIHLQHSQPAELAGHGGGAAELLAMQPGHGALDGAVGTGCFGG